MALGEDQVVVGGELRMGEVVAEVAGGQDRDQVGGGHAGGRVAGPGPGAGPDAVDPDLLGHLVQGLQLRGSRRLSGHRHLWSSWRGPGRALDARAAASPPMMNGGGLRSPGREGDAARPPLGRWGLQHRGRTGGMAHARVRAASGHRARADARRGRAAPARWARSATRSERRWWRSPSCSARTPTGRRSPTRLRRSAPSRWAGGCTSPRPSSPPITAAPSRTSSWWTTGRAAPG